MKDAFSIQEIFMTLKKRIVLIISLTISLILTAVIISYFVITPTYQSSSQFIVIHQPSQNNPVNLGELEMNLELINTYKEIVRSSSILEKVIKEVNLNTTPEELGKKIQVSSGEDSQVITVSAIGESPELAAQLTNLIVEHFQKTIVSIMNIDNVFILSKANPASSQKPIQPRPFINILIAGIIGVATSIGMALFLEFLDTKVKSEADIENLGITVLGSVSVIEKRKGKKEKEADDEKKQKNNRTNKFNNS
ncbi:YveK family protein [Ornithinibacillus halotolerans]|uniref:Capsular polysaccharide biosynthesis protein n=1 Tax=Ornithinibacillus halotolerans TaxID=1274357 RepID=A0A916W715_9BACI|nr:Wzz/FepE/Etk N-terminal domain-containing protein [Ornithinibacillus halotolerans]GGA72910.1 capsular polysaccharide biosynthesis protein [Ornithinibacillus halotolerans]